KVRCSGCKKVLNAPDKARGKTLKCPQCKTPIPIPSGKSEPDSSQDSSEFLANLDLRSAEDHSQQLCPRCGTPSEEEETHCSNCGADLATGIVPKKKKQKGPDTSEYFKTVWGDAWQFTMKNKSYMIRTILYNLVLQTAMLGALFMALWSSNTPPKVFWSFVTFIFFMAPIGWAWFLATETIRFSLKKEDELKRVNFDFFLCVALGIKYFVWGVVFGIPILLVCGGIAVPLMMSGAKIAAVAVIGIGYLMIYSMLPISMCHMAMPQQAPGWMINRVLPGWWRSLGGVLYLMLICFIVTLPVTATNVVMRVVYDSQITKVVQDLTWNASIDKAVQMKEELDEEFITDEVNRWAEATPVTVNYQPLTVPGILMGVSILFTGFTLVFCSRALGQFAFYYKRRMDLNSLERQFVYKAKKQKIDKEGNVIETGDSMPPALKAAIGFGTTVLIYVVVNIVTVNFFGFWVLPKPIARALNLIGGE
ncbi:MAG TPA: hypothetical protein VMM56_10015, partial [Planctomycetaceae bacterium]|nr:hypothetical protein [Planctomycetaceae bacterium]